MEQTTLTRKYSYIDIKKEYISNELFEFIYAFYWVQEGGKWIRKYDKFENKDYYLFVSPEDIEKVKTERYKMDETPYITIDGKICYKVDPLRKLNSEEFKSFRNKFHKTYESDVPALTRWINTNKPQYSEIVKICHIDIETIRETGNYSTVEEASDTIGLICIYDSLENDYVTFCHKDFDKDSVRPEIKVLKYKDEVKMLEAFCRYLNKRQPDYLTGWYMESYDIPYIINRMKNLKIDTRKLSPLDRIYYRKQESINQHRFSAYYISIAGIGIFDLASAAQRLWLGKYCGYSLAKMSKNYLKGEEKIKIGDITEAYYNRFEELIEYNWMDVKLCVDLNEKLQIFKKFQSLQNIMSINVNQTITQSNNINFYLWQHTDRVLFNSGMKEEEKTFEGGLVLDTVPGIHINPLKFDFVSEYPSIILTYNISTDTILSDFEEGCINMDKKFFFKREIGVITKVIKQMYDMRMKYKKEKNKDLTLAYKLLMNSVYGQFTAPYSRIFSRRCGEAITYMGRRLINELKSRIEYDKGEIILGDTDSIVVRNIGEKEVLEIANDTFEWMYMLDEIKENKYLKLDLEKKIDKLIIFGTEDKRIKKKYIEYVKGEDPEIKMVGLDAIKSDTPPIGRDLQIAMMEKVIRLDNPKIKDLDYVLEYYRKIFNKAIEEKEYSMIAIPSKLNKDINDYKMNSFAVKAVKNSNLGISTNQRFMVIMTTKGPRAFMSDEDLKNEVIKVSDSYMWERVEKKAKIFYELLGGNPQLYQQDLFTSS